MSNNTSVMALDGQTFSGSCAAGDALRAKGFEYVSPGISEGPSWYNHQSGEVMALVDDSGEGYTIQLDTRPHMLAMVASLATKST